MPKKPTAATPYNAVPREQQTISFADRFRQMMQKTTATTVPTSGSNAAAPSSSKYLVKEESSTASRSETGAQEARKDDKPTRQHTSAAVPPSLPSIGEHQRPSEKAVIEKQTTTAAPHNSTAPTNASSSLPPLTQPLETPPQEQQQSVPPLKSALKGSNSNPSTPVVMSRQGSSAALNQERERGSAGDSRRGSQSASLSLSRGTSNARSLSEESKEVREHSSSSALKVAHLAPATAEEGGKKRASVGFGHVEIIKDLTSQTSGSTPQVENIENFLTPRTPESGPLELSGLQETPQISETEQPAAVLASLNLERVPQSEGVQQQEEGAGASKVQGEYGTVEESKIVSSAIEHNTEEVKPEQENAKSGKTGPEAKKGKGEEQECAASVSSDGDGNCYKKKMTSYAANAIQQYLQELDSGNKFDPIVETKALPPPPPTSSEDISVNVSKTGTEVNVSNITSVSHRSVVDNVSDLLETIQSPFDLTDKEKTLLAKLYKRVQPHSGKRGGLGSGSGSMNSSSLPASYEKNEEQGGLESRSISASSNFSTSTAITPFISALAMKSFQLSRSDEPIVVPVVKHAAVMFVDLSGYSKVAKALEAKGAVALFEAVNAYLALIVERIVHGYKGEIVKFAGDAVMAVWYHGNIIAKSTHCALNLQESMGQHKVEGTDMMFELHIGIVVGDISSSVLVAEQARNMQPHFHFVTGECLKNIDRVVDAALPGQVCVSGEVVKNMCRGSYCEAVPEEADIYLLKHLEDDCCNYALFEEGDNDCEKDDDEESWVSEAMSNQDESEHIVEDYENKLDNMKHFIHQRLRERHRSGLRQSQMAELRLLAVAFIHKTENDMSVDDWFQEVAPTLDEYKCPIVQIIDDDKGVHLIAAVNLFYADREPAVTIVRMAKTLLEKEAGCTIGIACGMTFCGVVGSALAARWDIVGQTCVRACRLMQYGVAHNEPVVVGQSVLQYASDASLTEYFGESRFKGSPEPVKLFRIAPVDTRVLTSITSATRTCSSVHVAQFNRIQRLAVNDGTKQRCAVIIHGGPDSGKTFLAVRCLAGSGIVPFLHVAVTGCASLSVVETIASWFLHSIRPQVKTAAQVTMDAYRSRHVLKCMRCCFDLINTVIEEGLKYAIVVRQAQCLDPYSVSFLRQVATKTSKGGGRFQVFMTVVPQNGLLSWKALQEKFGGPLVCPNVEIGRLPIIEATALVEHCFGWRCDDDVIELIMHKSARVAGFIEKIIQTFVERDDIGKVGSGGVVRSSRVGLYRLNTLRWLDISPIVSTKASMLIDALTTSCKTILKVVSALKTPYSLFVPKLLVKKITARLVATALPDKIERDLSVLIDLNLLDVGSDDVIGEGVEGLAFTTPALADVTATISLTAQRTQCMELATEAIREDLNHVEGTALGSWSVMPKIGRGIDTPGTGESIFSIAAIGYYCAELLDRNGAEEAYRRLAPILIECAKKNRFFVQLIADAQDHVNAKEVHVPEITDYQVPELKTDKEFMPPQIIAVNKFRPPFSLGGLTLAWRQTAVAIRDLAIAAGSGSTVPASYLVEVQTTVRGYCRMIKIVDKHVGYTCPINELQSLLGWLRNGSFEEVCNFGAEFLNYYETVLTPRIDACHKHFLRCRCLPPMPVGKKPFWVGPARVGMEKALQAVIHKWEDSETEATLNGMMVMGTQGWIPKNPDQTLEFQRDCYFKTLSHPKVCFPSLLYVNLCLFWDE